MTGQAGSQGDGDVVGLVVAKAPVPGAVKTRLAATVGASAAAELAAVALLDTLDALEEAYGAGRCHLSLAGDLGEARRGQEIADRLRSWTVHPQRGDGLGDRLARAHLDAGGIGCRPVVQVGMDTPQLRPHLLREVADRVTRGGHDAVVGPAYDGGWWVLALRDVRHARVLTSVPMSAPHTYAETVRALRGAGARVDRAIRLRDVDTEADAHAVAVDHPGRFGVAWLDHRGAPS